jgi:hypothetical protein
MESYRQALLSKKEPVTLPVQDQDKLLDKIGIARHDLNSKHRIYGSDFSIMD